MTQALPSRNEHLELIREENGRCVLRCKCGKEWDVATKRWRYRTIKSCGCETRRIHNAVVHEIFRTGKKKKS
jgi:acetone carboxylase gamma subunit